MAQKQKLCAFLVTFLKRTPTLPRTGPCEAGWSIRHSKSHQQNMPDPTATLPRPPHTHMAYSANGPSGGVPGKNDPKSIQKSTKINHHHHHHHHQNPSRSIKNQSKSVKKCKKREKKNTLRSQLGI